MPKTSPIGLVRCGEDHLQESYHNLEEPAKVLILEEITDILTIDIMLHNIAQTGVLRQSSTEVSDYALLNLPCHSRLP